MPCFLSPVSGLKLKVTMQGLSTHAFSTAGCDMGAAWGLGKGEALPGWAVTAEAHGRRIGGLHQ